VEIEATQTHLLVQAVRIQTPRSERQHSILSITNIYMQSQ
jgi:hypothetical protein